MSWRLETYDELASTSDLCAARAKAGEPAGLAILALTQTAGRGSRGRGWIAPNGNLNLSILLRPNLPAAEAGIFSLLAGLATAEALNRFLLALTITLKWPNDLLINGAKLGGILIDASPAGTSLDWLVIGIGINLAIAPAIPGRATTSLAVHNAHTTPAQVCSAILDRLAACLTTLATTGPAPIQSAWLTRAHPIGTQLTVNTTQTTISGAFAGLSPTGELLLHTENRIHRINTGEIMLGGGA